MLLQIFFIGLEGSFPTIPILQVLAEMHFNRVAFIGHPVQSSLLIPPLLFTFPVLLYFSSQFLKYLHVWNNGEKV